jgi:Na+/H+ antiporter NhaC
VLLSLGSGILLGLYILNDFTFLASLEAIFKLFSSLLHQMWILKTLAFAIFVGSIMALLQKSGGIAGFVDNMKNRHSLVDSKRSALMLSYFIGIFIFIESSITALISGAVGRPFCKEYGISNAKLAFVCDSTSAPVSSLILLNGWGALLLGLISTQVTLGMIEGDSVAILIEAVFYNFYAMSALVVTFLSIWFNVDIGSMRSTSYTTKSKEDSDTIQSSMYYMLLPIFLLIILVFVFLYITGDGNMLKGSGSSSIFYTTLSTLIFMLFYYVGTKNMSLSVWGATAFKGAKELFSIAMILLFAFAIGKVTSELNTGLYLASLASENLNINLLAAVVFLLSSVMAFATGTSWGTFSIMIPVAVPMAVGMDANVALAIGAVISGGVFGDHCSPISDTTIISSLAADCEVIEHVKTQLPYALLSGTIAFVSFIIFS